MGRRAEKHPDFIPNNAKRRNFVFGGARRYGEDRWRAAAGRGGEGGRGEGEGGGNGEGSGTAVGEKERARGEAIF